MYVYVNDMLLSFCVCKVTMFHSVYYVPYYSIVYYFDYAFYIHTCVSI